MEISRAIRAVQLGVLLINEHLTNFLPRWPHEKRSYTPLLPAIETRRKILIAFYVVHSRIDRDRCETAFCQCPPNSDVARDVEIHHSPMQTGLASKLHVPDPMDDWSSPSGRVPSSFLRTESASLARR